MMQYELLSKIYYKSKESYEQTYQNRLHGETTVRLPLSIKSHEAFIVFNQEIAELIDKIHITASGIAGLSISEIAGQQFALLCLSNEVLYSNEIEGVKSTRKQISSILHEQNSNAKLAPLTLKYEKLLSGVDIPLNTPQDLRNLYDEILLADVIGEDNNNAPDGELFRKSEVHISDGQKIIHSGLFGETSIIRALTDLLDLVNSEALSEIVKIPVMHYFIGFIHPFYDGNGRLMRFLSSYQLSKLFQPIVALNLSYTIKENKNSYYKLLENTNDETNKGDITGLIIGFFELILQAVSNLEVYILKKKEQEQTANEKMQTAAFAGKTSKRIAEAVLMNSIYGTQDMQLPDIIKATGFSSATIRNSIRNDLDYSWFIKKRDGKHFIYYIDLNRLLTS